MFFYDTTTWMIDWSPRHTPTRERPTREEVRFDPRRCLYFFPSFRRASRARRASTPRVRGHRKARGGLDARGVTRATSFFPAKRGLIDWDDASRGRRRDDDATLDVGGIESGDFLPNVSSSSSNVVQGCPRTRNAEPGRWDSTGSTPGAGRCGSANSGARGSPRRTHPGRPNGPTDRPTDERDDDAPADDRSTGGRKSTSSVRPVVVVVVVVVVVPPGDVVRVVRVRCRGPFVR